MATSKLPDDFEYLKEMYDDDYFPNNLVDKVKAAIIEVVVCIQKGGQSKAQIQEVLDNMTIKINNLQEEFEENDSELETVARDSIGVTVENILQHFNIDIDIEEAIRERDW